MKWTDWTVHADWKPTKLLVDEAYAHPAKFNYGLISTIIAHGLVEGYWKPGDLIGDPFAGVACGALVAAFRGLRWVGVELEERFVALAQANIDRNRGKLETAGDPIPVILQGDSRAFASIIGQCEAVVTSPPYAKQAAPHDVSPDWAMPGWGNRPQGASYGHAPGQIGSLKAGELDAVVTSPPYNKRTVEPPSARARAMRTESGRDPECTSWNADGYGTTPGQIGSLKVGELDAVVTSPPYAESIQGAHGERETAEETTAKRKTPGGSLGQSQRHGGYGTEEGQIGSLRAGDLDAVVTSPPYSAQTVHSGDGIDYTKTNASGRSIKTSYGKTEGQIGRDSGETYWQAVAAVYEQCRLALKPGGLLVVVVKDYVKNKQRVPLCDDTAKLLEHLGFHVFERTRAHLVEVDEHPGLFGEPVVKKKERKSFFKRLAEGKGSPRIDWEEVIWSRKL